jgi:hypothetical protein
VNLPLLILVAIWVAFGASWAWKRLQGSSDSISSFHQQLRTLERTRPGLRPITPRAVGPMTPRPIAMAATSGMPAGRAEARRRRREILYTLGGAMAITLVLAVFLGGVVILCNLVADAMLGGYLYLLVQMRKTEAERSAKVRYLRAPAEASEPSFLLRRSASN